MHFPILLIPVLLNPFSPPEYSVKLSSYNQTHRNKTLCFQKEFFNLCPVLHSLGLLGVPKVNQSL